jgi:16S rRNA (guanine527-N7)-methyltransferase
MGGRYLILYILNLNMDELAQLTESASALGIALKPEDGARLLRLLDELSHWNRSYNLTAITDRRKMITHHLLDSLSIHADLHGRSIADVGTGAGFPGLPLAVIDPSRHYTLIDSSNKKVRFVTHVAHLLALPNVTPLHARAETMRPERPFDTVVARALAALPDILKTVLPLCGPATRVLAMKGKRPTEEIAAISSGWRVVEDRALEVPGIAESRSLVILEPDGVPVAGLTPRE